MLWEVSWYKYFGSSSIIGPSRNTWEPYYYAGHKFTDEVADESEMFSATIDLSLATKFLDKDNPSVNGTDWRPDKYIDMYKDALKNPEYGK